MAATEKKVIILKTGEDYGITFFLRDRATGLPIDISTWMFKAAIKKDIDDIATIGDFVFSAAFLDPEDSTWKVVRSITSAKIADLNILEGTADQFYSDDGGTIWKKMVRWSIVVEKKATVLT